MISWYEPSLENFHFTRLCFVNFREFQISVSSNTRDSRDLVRTRGHRLSRDRRKGEKHAFMHGRLLYVPWWWPAQIETWPAARLTRCPVLIARYWSNANVYFLTRPVGNDAPVEYTRAEWWNVSSPPKRRLYLLSAAGLNFYSLLASSSCSSSSAVIVSDSRKVRETRRNEKRNEKLKRLRGFVDTRTSRLRRKTTEEDPREFHFARNL